MKLLITGGAGFIGSNLVRYFLEEHQDVEVINLDLLTYAGNLDNVAGLEEDPRYRFVHGDICDATLVGELVGEVDAVLNLAAESPRGSLHRARHAVRSDQRQRNPYALERGAGRPEPTALRPGLDR